MTSVDTIESVLQTLHLARRELELELELDPSRLRAVSEAVAEQAEIPVALAIMLVRNTLSMHPSSGRGHDSGRGTVRELPAMVAPADITS